jgi:protein-disulfide isomerase
VSKLESDEGDLTRKQRREQAREERKAAEQAAAAGDARRKRMTQLGGAVAVVIVAIVVILVATGGGGKKNPKIEGEKGGQSTEVKKAVSEVTKEIDGIPQSGNVLGSPTAPVTLQYFGDLECPICKEFTLGALPALIQKWVKTGKLRVEYRNLETATREPEVFTTQQTDALAAGKQNKGWYFIELFYHLQGEEDSGYVTEKYLQGLAAATPGLNLAKWSSDRSDQTLQAKIATDTQEANNNGFTGTPSFLLGKSGGALKKFEYSSLTDPASFNEAIEKLLKA